MIKIIMEHDERMNDIIDKAEKIIFKKGYDKTSIAEIIKKVGIAKGTFYHYFKSKDELLDAIIDRMLKDIWSNLDEIIYNNNLNAIDKVFQFFVVFRKSAKGRESLIEFIHKEENAPIHLKVEKIQYPVIIPKFEIIIRQGIKEKVFDTKYPLEAAAAIIGSITMLTEIREHTHGLKDGEVDIERVKMFFDLIERIVGAKPGILMKCLKKMEGDKN